MTTEAENINKEDLSYKQAVKDFIKDINVIQILFLMTSIIAINTAIYFQTWIDVSLGNELFLLGLISILSIAVVYNTLDPLFSIHLDRHTTFLTASVLSMMATIPSISTSEHLAISVPQYLAMLIVG